MQSPGTAAGAVNSRRHASWRSATLPTGGPGTRPGGSRAPGRSRVATVPGGCMGPIRAGHRARRVHGPNDPQARAQGGPAAPITHVCLFGEDRGRRPARWRRRPGCGRDGVLDGEVVAFDEAGRPSFEALQGRMAGRAGRRRGAAVTYLVFDLLWLDGRLLTGLPYAERRDLLEELALAGPAWRTVGSFAGRGPPCWPRPGSRAWRGSWPNGSRAGTCRDGGPGTGSRSSTTSARRSWSAASCPTATRSGRCSSASPIRSGQAGCGSPAGSTAWCRRPGGGSGSCWARW
jgi:ATP dependent DNA ligase domain